MSILIKKDCVRLSIRPSVPVRPSVCLSVHMYVNAALTEEPSDVIFCKHIHIIPGSVIGAVVLSPEVNFGKYIIFCKAKKAKCRKGKYMSGIGKTHSSKVGLQFPLIQLSAASHPVKCCFKNVKTFKKCKKKM
ncbi:unnamed protein product [Meganyctiphanes norvegica]|uniref:Uncharacterized protein n=1 Tax=Meganyctiphanes norvegica TaxID=48144 RepID=A0AAV2SU86_MEGNR